MLYVCQLFCTLSNYLVATENFGLLSAPLVSLGRILTMALKQLLCFPINPYLFSTKENYPGNPRP